MDTVALLPEYSVSTLDVVHCMNALDLLRALPSASVDCVVTDPPYGTTACEWDSIIPIKLFWEQIKRVTKPGAVIAIFGSQPFTSLMIVNNLNWFRYEWIWEKSQGTGYLNAWRNPMKSHENIMIFYDRLKIYNPQFERGLPYRATRGAAGGVVREKTVGGYLTVSDGLRFPKTVLKFKSETGLHPTQKPEMLIRHLVHTYTNPGDLILDPFIGSGTTAIAARNSDRHFIGCDISPEYVTLSRKRLAMPYTLPMFA